MNHQQIFDPFFIETALHLGYRKEDLELLQEERILSQSKPILKGKSQIQRTYYLKKKAQASQMRRQRIIMEVAQEVEKQKCKNSKKSSFNPIIMNSLKQHEAKPQRKIKQVQKPIRKKLQMKNICNTIDFGRTAPNFNTFIGDQEFSRKLLMSSESSLSSKNSQQKHQNMLNMTRQKQMKIQVKNSKKTSKVIEEKLNISCKLKTRSQISNQSARQRQREVENIYTSTQFKAFNTKRFNSKNEKESQNRKKSQNLSSINSKEKEGKDLILSQSRDRCKNIYQNKMKILALSKQKIEFERQSERNLKSKEQEIKKTNIRLHEEKIGREEQSKRKTMYYGMKNLELAEKLRQNDKKFNHVDNRVKMELFRKNKNSLQIKREISNSNKKHQKKSNELVEIEKLKRKLNKQSVRYGENVLKYSSYDRKRNTSFFY